MPPPNNGLNVSPTTCLLDGPNERERRRQFCRVTVGVMTIYLNLSTLYYNTVVAWKQRLANLLTGLIGNAIYVKKS